MLVTLEISPNAPQIAIADNISLSPAGPYGKDHITVTVNPNVTDYQSNVDTGSAGFEVSQQMTYGASEHSRKLHFDFKNKQQQLIKVAGQGHTIRLMSIDEVDFDGQKFPTFTFDISDAVVQLTGLQKEGSVTFWCESEEYPSWPTDGNTHRFPPVQYLDQIAVQAIKHEDNTLEIGIEGPFAEVFTTRKELSECGPKGAYVAITWKDDVVKFYINASEVDQIAVGN